MTRLKRCECSVLPLVLKGRWFDMIATGQKREEYRELSDYWKTRIVNWMKSAEASGLPCVIEFRRGYAARAQRTAFLLDGVPKVRLKFRFLHPDWGEPQGEHYVLTLGERVVLEGGETTKQRNDETTKGAMEG